MQQTIERVGERASLVPADDLDEDRDERSPLARAIAAAFQYHPSTWKLPVVHDGWVIAPTFMVKAEDPSVDGESSPELWQKATGILSGAKHAKDPVTVSAKGHKMTQQFRKDKYGSLNPMSPKKCTCRAIIKEGPLGDNPIGEVAFPLLRLGKKVGVTDWKIDYANQLLLYGYKGRELVAVVMSKIPDPLCLLEEEA